VPLLAVVAQRAGMRNQGCAEFERGRDDDAIERIARRGARQI
jgi:hypothetical protein